MNQPVTETGVRTLPESKRLPLWLTALTVGALLLLYWPTVFSMVMIWSRSETFTHGYIIFPISAYLIWRRRSALLAVDYRPDWRAVFVIVGLGMGWMLAHAGEVQVIEQYAVVGLIPVIVWAMLGRRAAQTILFPLMFLLLAVPVGEFLIPYMMNFTADFTVTALRLTGIPVYREGTFFTIPSGEWSVVEACSGLRYLIASFTLGTLYAYLTYRSFWRRALFSLMAIVVPVIANGLRAYMIVMIGHLSGMRLAVGFDHLIYGWVFFGLVMALLFWVGAFWREDDQESSPQKMVIAESAAPAKQTSFIKMSVLVLALLLPWLLYAHYLDARLSAKADVTLSAPIPVRGWQEQITPLADWKPHYKNASAELMRTYRRDGKSVGLYLAYYRTQYQDMKLISTQNVMIPQNDPVWGNIGTSPHTVNLDSGALPVSQTLLKSAHQRLLIWEWQRIKGRNLDNPYLGKLLLALNKVAGRQDDGAAIVVFTPYEGDPAQVAPVLQAFLADMLPAIEAGLDRVAEPSTHGR
ncbi:MAG: exosortase A [Burkholderiales bacterium]